MTRSLALERLSREIEAFAAALPPVHSWSPPREGRIDIRIDEDGRWWHEGGAIEREALVVLFASILRCDGPGEYALVTPAERLRIEVADVPFLIVDVERADTDASDPVWVATTSLGESVWIGEAHPIRGASSDETGAAYCVVRPVPGTANGRLPLEGRLSRAAWYRLAEALETTSTSASLQSGGVTHTLARWD
ncbi:MAG: DUF1285 domain-containing protein [Pseudomonadota bacterium]